MVDGITEAVLKLDAWFETMRGPLGFYGPVTHWWESNLLYCGPKMDWRYEGIIIGYLNLFDCSGDSFWLNRAIRAADDVRNTQLSNGQFLNSSFQQGPIEGGTPHEAAVDVALLELAIHMRRLGDERWRDYQRTAWFNLQAYHIDQLWNGIAFLDQPWNQVMVANKNATIMEALLLQQQLCGNDLERYILAAADLVMSAQVRDRSKPYFGGVVHMGTDRQQLVIGIYTARCASALLRLYEYHPQQQILDAAAAMGRYLVTLVTKHGTHFGHYHDGQLITHPTWISPSGDLLRALIQLRCHNDSFEHAVIEVVNMLVKYQHTTGGIPTSFGLVRKGMTKPIDAHLFDFLDILPVVGWCDKAFRGLSMIANPKTGFQANPYEHTFPWITNLPCYWKGKLLRYFEDRSMIQCDSSLSIYFEYKKGHSFCGTDSHLIRRNLNETETKPSAR